MGELQECIFAVNKWVREFKTATEKMRDIERSGGRVNDAKVVIHAEQRPSDVHARRGNAQETNEMAVVMNDPTGYSNDLFLHLRSAAGTNNGMIQKIKWKHRARDPLHYPVFFPCGTTDGYHEQMMKYQAVRPGDDPTAARTMTKMSPMDYYSYRLHERARCADDDGDAEMEDDDEQPPGREFCALFRGARLFHEYCLDAYCKSETDRLEYQVNHQELFKSEFYGGLLDAVNANDVANAGKRVVLHPSFKGGPRQMNPALAHCNGTRYIVTAMSLRVLKLKMVGSDKTLLVPRFQFSSDPDLLSFTVKRRQFPIRPAFAMTVNKAQGQTLKKAGVFLERPIFARPLPAVRRLMRMETTLRGIGREVHRGNAKVQRTQTHRMVEMERSGRSIALAAPSCPSAAAGAPEFLA